MTFQYKFCMGVCQVLSGFHMLFDFLVCNFTHVRLCDPKHVKQAPHTTSTTPNV